MTAPSAAGFTRTDDGYVRTRDGVTIHRDENRTWYAIPADGGDSLAFGPTLSDVLDQLIAQDARTTAHRRYEFALSTFLEQISEHLNSDPVAPTDFTGTAGEMLTNAKRYVAATQASYVQSLIADDATTTVVDAARAVIELADRHLRQVARFAPRSSDWLALPRWAAHVEAAAATTDIVAAAGILIGHADTIAGLNRS
jgi:hypothetical protein